MPIRKSDAGNASNIECGVAKDEEAALREIGRRKIAAGIRSREEKAKPTPKVTLPYVSIQHRQV